MGGNHAGHDHSHVPKNEKKIAIAAGLTGAFMIAEVVGGVVSGSLALIADAGHMLTDFASLVLAWLAFRLARRPADWQRTYGFARFSVLAAFVNGLSLFAIAAWIVYEAIERLRAPGEVLGSLMLWVAVGGLVVNILAFIVLTRGESDNLNVRAAALHVAGDLLGSIAPIDPLLSMLVVLIILRSAWAVVKESGHILLEGAPDHLDRRELAERLMRIDGVEHVGHIHAWSVTQERPVITLEITTAADRDPEAIKREAKGILRDEYHVDHATVEMHSGAAQGARADC